MIPGDEEEGPGQLVLFGLDGFQSGHNGIDGQGFYLIVDHPKRNIADGLGIVGDNFPDRPVGILDQGLVGNLFFSHDQMFKGIPGPRAFLPGDEMNGFL